VVVRPLIDSKNASPTRSNVPSMRNGAAPATAATSHASVTARKPSRARIGAARSRRARVSPATLSGIRTAAGAPKASVPPPPSIAATTKHTSSPSATASTAPETTGVTSCQLIAGRKRGAGSLTRRGTRA